MLQALSGFSDVLGGDGRFREQERGFREGRGLVQNSQGLGPGGGQVPQGEIQEAKFCQHLEIARLKFVGLQEKGPGTERTALVEINQAEPAERGWIQLLDLEHIPIFDFRLVIFAFLVGAVGGGHMPGLFLRRCAAGPGENQATQDDQQGFGLDEVLHIKGRG